MNLLFAEAERIAVDPRPRVVIGITKRSYGFFHFNRREKDARALLATDGVDPEIRRDLAQIVLPGTNINTSWLLAVEALYRRLDRVADMRPDYARYRRLQALYCEQARHLHRMISRSELRQAEAGLAPAERALLRVFGPVAGRVGAGRTGASAARRCVPCSVVSSGSTAAPSSPSVRSGATTTSSRCSIASSPRHDRRRRSRRDERGHLRDVRRSGDRGARRHRSQPPPLRGSLHLLPLHVVPDAAARARPRRPGALLHRRVLRGSGQSRRARRRLGRRALQARADPPARPGRAAGRGRPRRRRLRCCHAGRRL